MAIIDIDDVIAPVLERTVVFWVLPYAMWFLMRHSAQKTWDWVTEPVEE